MKTLVYSKNKDYFFIEEIAKELGSNGFWQPTHPENEETSECLPFVFWKLKRGEVMQIDDNSDTVESYRKTACRDCLLGIDGVCKPIEEEKS